jgi:hypothetical protein
MRFFILLISILCSVIPCYAWELQLNGSYDAQFRYLSRTGPNDLFGNVGTAQRSANTPGITTIGFSGPWSGVVSPEVLR